MTWKIEITLKKDNQLVDAKTATFKGKPLAKLLWTAVCQGLSKTPAEGVFDE